MSLDSDFLAALEEHSPDGIRKALVAGASPTAPINDQVPIDALIAGYLRSPRFTTCLALLLDAGAVIEDPVLRSLLLDDDRALRLALTTTDDWRKRPLRVPCAFTSCIDVTPLHICAEFNSVRCARTLLEAGADVNSRAGVDENGFGGQTPIFHTVNSILNYCRPTLEMLVEAGADLEIRLKGVVWGRDQDWETTLLDVTPMSYAQCGLYAQFHRREQDVYSNLEYLYLGRHGTRLPVRNVPNKYLAPR